MGLTKSLLILGTLHENLRTSHENKPLFKKIQFWEPCSVSKLVEQLYVILARCQGPWDLNAPRFEGLKLCQTLSMEPEGPKDRWCNGAKARRLQGPQARECPKAGNCTKQSSESLKARNRTKQAPWAQCQGPNAPRRKTKSSN